jgi:hypothetical protein
MPDGTDLVKLRQILTEHFDEGELRTLCFDLRVDYQSLPGEGKADKARELVAYCDRHERIAELEDQVHQVRSNAPKTIHDNLPHRLYFSKREAEGDRVKGCPYACRQRKVQSMLMALTSSDGCAQSLGDDNISTFSRQWLLVNT